jgi:putative membrane protein
MMRALTEDQKRRVERRVSETEAGTGAEIVVAVIERCDAYPEVPWKAFALVAAGSGLLARILGLSIPAESLPRHGWMDVALVLGCGALAALLTVWVPPFARLFLDRHRAEGETRQRAESVFLSRRLFATRRRTAILLLVGLFERQAVLLPDSGIAERLASDGANRVIERMRPLLGAGRVAPALEEGLEALAEALRPIATAERGGNQIPDGVWEEGGGS